MRKPWGGTTGDDCAPSRSVRAPTRNHTHTSRLRTTGSCEDVFFFLFLFLSPSFSVFLSFPLSFPLSLFLSLCLTYPRAALREVFSNLVSRDFPAAACRIGSTSISNRRSTQRDILVFLFTGEYEKPSHGWLFVVSIVSVLDSPVRVRELFALSARSVRADERCRVEVRERTFQLSRYLLVTPAFNCAIVIFNLAVW